MFIKKIAQFTPFYLILFLLVLTSCKKTPTTPDMDALNRPVIWLNHFELSFTAAATGENPSTQTLQVKNSGQKTLKYSISIDAEWLSVSPENGSSTGQIIEHQVLVNKDGLTVQDEHYSATITITCSEAYNNPQSVSVNLKINKKPPPKIKVTPNTLTFSAKEGAISNPSSKTIQIKNIGEQTLNYSVSDDASWLYVSPKKGSSKDQECTHKVSIDCQGLSKGTYNGKIHITDSKACNSPQTVDVILTVSEEPPPEIWVSTPALEFIAKEGSSNPSPQNIRIKNSGNQTLNYSIVDDAAWLSVKPKNGSSTGGENSHTVSVDISELSMGTYTGTIAITDSKASNSPQAVNVTLTIAEQRPPEIWVSPSSLTFSAQEGGANPSSQEIRIKNSGEQSLNYNITDDADWLSVKPTSGSSTGGENAHTVSVVINSLGEGTYSGTITITDPNASNSASSVNVTLTVSKQPPPEIWVSSSSLTFSAEEGAGNPASQNIKIKNSGEQTLNYSISDDADWLSVNPASGSSTGGENSHSVSVDISGLSSGSHTGTITVSDPNASNNPQSVAVTLNISQQQPPEIWVSPVSLTFIGTEGGSNPSSQSLKIKNSGAQTLNYTLSDDAGWLSVSPTSGSSTGEENSHTVSVNISGMSSGSYPGTITITDSNASNNPQTVSVTLNLSSPPSDDEISISCDPSSGGTGTIVSIPITINGNQNEIEYFGLKMTFDTSMFQFHSISKGSLTGDWATVDGNEISGTITIGGFMGSGTPVSAGSSGSLAIVKLKVTCGACSDGQQSQISINTYTDDIQGMTPEPAYTKFTYRK